MWNTSNKRKASDTDTDTLSAWLKKPTPNPDVKSSIFQKYRQDREAANNKAIANTVYNKVQPKVSQTFGITQKNTVTIKPISNVPQPSYNIAPPKLHTLQQHKPVNVPQQKSQQASASQQKPYQTSIPQQTSTSYQKTQQVPTSQQKPQQKTQQIPTSQQKPYQTPIPQQVPTSQQNTQSSNKPTYSVNKILQLPAIIKNSKRFIIDEPIPEEVITKKAKTKVEEVEDTEDGIDEYLANDDDDEEDPVEFNGRRILQSFGLDDPIPEEQFYGDDDDEAPANDDDDDEIEIIPTTTLQEDIEIRGEAEGRRRQFQTAYQNKDYKNDRYDPRKQLLLAPKLKLNEEDKPFERFIKARREKEIAMYHTDNYYDFSEFTAFSNEDEEQECLDWDNSKDFIFYVTACSWKYTEKYGTVLEFKGNKDGMTISPSSTVITTGFKSTFYIQPPAHWTDSDVLKLRYTLNHVVKNLYKWKNYRDKKIVDKISQLFVKHETVTAESINGYTTEDGRKMYKIYSLFPKAIAVARKILNQPFKYDWPYSNVTIRVFDADVDFTQRYFYDTKSEPCRWFIIHAHEYEVMPAWSRGRASRSKIEIVCKNEHMSMISKDNEDYKNKVPSFLVASYDTEQCNKPFKFPAPRVFPMIVKTLNISRYPDYGKSKNVLMVYVHNGELPVEFLDIADDPTKASAELPGIDYFYWFKSEPALMEHFRRFMIHTDVDATIDYNGGCYDWQRILENGSMYFGENYRIFGKDLYKKTWINRTEWRARTDYSVNVDGRWCIDMVKRARAEAPFWV